MGIYSAKRALLANIIDYAGTFPPAALSLENALKEAATFRRVLKYPWLVSKMALPLPDLKTLTPKSFYQAGSDGTPWIFTALGSAPTDGSRDEISRTIEWELREIERFNARGFDSSCRHQIIAYETKLPPEALMSNSNADDWLKFLGPILERFEARSSGAIQLYWEVGIESIDDVSRFADALCIWCEEEGDGATVPGLKVRTGGKQTPSATSLAHFVDIVTSRGLKFKATQGLHEAVTHESSFGFLNLFAALTLSQAIGKNGFPVSQIEALLKDSNAEHFSFEANRFSWKEFSLDLEKIEAARRHHAGCFGSCSIVEPDESLAKTFPDME
jgi:hypothetical protein